MPTDLPILISESSAFDVETLEILKALERKVLWLSTYMIHHANHLRDKTDGLKVGGHQASSASLATIMTALYFHVLRPEDRVAVKPHASPVFHAIQYLLGNQKLENLQNFRAFHGAQSYPSRTKDEDDVDLSTGSVGLGVASTAFASIVQDYVRAKNWGQNWPEGRMIGLMGDAELDEGNIYEALLECWKHGLKNCWWIIDYNRQSLDAVVNDRLFSKMADIFEAMGWQVITLKYGRDLQAIFEMPGGERLRDWIDSCPNSLYSALAFQGGAAWRQQLKVDFPPNSRIAPILDDLSDDKLARLMTNLGGHDMASALDAFATAPRDRPVCFIAYTIKGFGLPFQGHKDNHAGLMTKDQMAAFQKENGVPAGQEWDPYSGLNLSDAEIEGFLQAVPFNARGRRRLQSPKIETVRLTKPDTKKPASTQEGFGRYLADLARSDLPLANRIVTTSPDVTVSTNLGPWVNRRGLFGRTPQEDVFKERGLLSPQRWETRLDGQHIELGIAENNLFLLLGALGLSHSLFGERLIPIGTLYDPFINRGLDALNHACYQDARFILVATPSGIALAPEGGAHQSIGTPLVGMAQDGLAAFEPAFVDELGAILEWAFDYIQRDGGTESHEEWLRDESGGSVYLRLSTRPIEQVRRSLDDGLTAEIIRGGYWLRPPEPGTSLAIAYSGAVAPEAIAAAGLLAEDCRGVGVLAVTSADRLSAGWHAAARACEQGAGQARSHVDELLSKLPRDAALITIADAHPEILSWLGAVRGHRVRALGVEHFGQSGSIAELFGHHGIDVNAILAAAETLRGGRPIRYRM